MALTKNASIDCANKLAVGLQPLAALRSI